VVTLRQFSDLVCRVVPGLFAYLEEYLQDQFSSAGFSSRIRCAPTIPQFRNSTVKQSGLHAADCLAQLLWQLICAITTWTGFMLSVAAWALLHGRCFCP